MTFWLIVTTQENWERCLAKGVWGVGDDYAETISKVSPGDEMFVFVKGMRGAGIVRASTKVYRDATPIWKGAFIQTE